MNKNKTNKYKLIALCFLFLSGTLLTPAWADEAGDLSKAVLEKWQDAIITARVVVEVYESERKTEILLTVIDESGLSVSSLSSISPASIFGSGMDETKVKSITMILSDKEEIPANVVLRDQDLDLAFIKPSEKIDKKLTAIDLADNSTPEILDHIVMLSRLGNAGGYAPVVSVSRIEAIIKKPRTMFMTDPMKALLSGLGIPVYTLDGKVIGLNLMRASKSTEMVGDDLTRGMGALPTLPIILPAQEIIDIIKNAGL
jgi:hypothetical protein